MTSVDVEETLRAHWREDGRGPEAEEALRARRSEARESEGARAARERAIAVVMATFSRRRRARGVVTRCD